MTKTQEMTTTGAPATPGTPLDSLREEIDRIDRDLHTRLIERGEIIDRLIAVKARQPGTSAFRPAREADMMRRLVTRHRGILPLATVEGIWRIIISTFTYVQSPYTVHADVSLGDPAMRDSARFHFGFTVPLATHSGAKEVISAVAEAAGDLGLLRMDDPASPWWDALTPPEAPKVIARLPFVERADHAAGLPLFIVAKPLQDGATRDVQLFAVQGAGVGQRDPGGFVEIVIAHGDSLIVAVPERVSADLVTAAFQTSGEPAPRVAFIGSHAARFEVDPNIEPPQ